LRYIVDNFYKVEYNIGMNREISPEVILQIRESLSESRREFADRFLVSHKTIWAWENGRRSPSPLAVVKLCELLDSITVK
jgi:DNA-binding transcriptional regulator YiaG